MTALYIAAAIPVFFALIAVELVVARRRGLTVYRFNDAITDLSCGIGSQMMGLIWKAAIFAVYVLVYEHAALFTWDASSPVTWLAGLLLVDHQYYWWHRTTHRSRLFWVTHVVHHQSEEYNLAVALRQAWFSSWTGLLFDLPIALLGIPPVVFAVSAIVNLLYQFWIHTELIGKLGPLEWVLNTPSHHRVHHAVDPRYLDRNYAGILIVWDRLYGTFIEEEEHPTYGTVAPLRSWNPVWANLGPVVELWRDTRRIERPVDRLRYVFGPPEWAPDELGGPKTIPEPEQGRITWDARGVPAVHAYIAAHFVVIGAAVTATLALAGTWPLPVKLAVVATIVTTTVVWGGLFEDRAWARPVELGRLAVVAVGALAAWQVGALGGWAPLLSVVGGLLSAAWITGPGRRDDVAAGPPVAPA